MNAEWALAIRRNDVSTLAALLAAGADVDARDRHGQTALMLAARHGRRELAALLVAHGADLDVTAKYGLSALMLAVVNAHAELARDLARAGADRTLTGNGAPGFAGKTARDLAAAQGLHELAAELAP